MNVLLHARVASSPLHDVCVRELERARTGRNLAWSDLVLAAVVRISTNPRVYQPPATTADAFRFVDAIRTTPHAVRVEPGERHWEIFEDLVLGTPVSAADTTDAWFAALAIEHGCDWWTTDKGFARFPGLRWRDLGA